MKKHFVVFVLFEKDFVNSLRHYKLAQLSIFGTMTSFDWNSLPASNLINS